jgi:hypothetical protein
MLSPLRSSDILTLSKGIRSELLQCHPFIEVRRVASNEWLKMSSRTSSFNLNTGQHETKKSLEK